MDQRTVKVALACLIGTSIGIITMLGIYPALWPLGLITGLIGGYLSYEYKKVIQAVPTAWNMARGWRLDIAWWKEYLIFFLILSSALLTVLLPLGFIISHSESEMMPITVFLIIISEVMAASFVISYLCAKEKDQYDYNNVKRLLIKVNPLNVYFHLLPKYLFIGAWRLFIGIPFACGVIRRFIWILVKLVYSDERLLCGIYSSVGALAFHLSGGNVLIGLVVGVLGGVLNYEILSKRIWKLVPMK